MLLTTIWPALPEAELHTHFAQGSYAALSYVESPLATDQAKEVQTVTEAAIEREFNSPAVESLREKAEAVRSERIPGGATFPGSQLLCPSTLKES